MRRNMILVLAAVTLTGGCGKGAFSANSGVVTSINGQELKSEWIADVIHNTKGMPATPQMVQYLADLWVDLSLFSQAGAAGKLKDSTTIANAMWFHTLQFELAHWNDSLVAQRIKISDTQIDSAIKSNEWRVPQHILIQVLPSASAADKAAAKKKAEGILAKIRAGADFGQLATENTDDPGSKATKGFYGASPKGRYTPEFDKALWELAPGKVSGLVMTSYGIHIIRRATDAEAAEAMVKLRGELKDTLINRQGAQMSQEYVAGLAKTNDLQVEKDAGTKVKGALDDLEGNRDSHTKLATYKGGSFTIADFVRWLQVGLTDPQGGPGMIDDLKQQPDSILADKFIKNLATNDMLLADAMSHHVNITKEEWAQERDAFNAGTDSLLAHIGIDSTIMKMSGSAREQAAGAKVFDFFKRIQAHEVSILPEPGFLAYVLRGRTKVHLNADGVKNAVDMAVTKAAADSGKTGAPPAGDAGGAMKPADGPPPLPAGATPPPASTAKPKKP